MDKKVQRKVVRITLRPDEKTKTNLHHKCSETKNAYNHFIFCATFYYKF